MNTRLPLCPLIVAGALVLAVFVPSQGLAQQVLQPPHSGSGSPDSTLIAPSADTPNVVLGSEFVLTARLLEDLVGLQQELQEVKHEIAEVDVSSSSSQELTDLKEQITAILNGPQQALLESLRTRLSSIKAELPDDDSIGSNDSIPVPTEIAPPPSLPVTDTVVPPDLEPSTPVEPAPHSRDSVSSQLDDLEEAIHDAKKGFNEFATEVRRIRLDLIDKELSLSSKEHRIDTMTGRLDSLEMLISASAATMALDAGLGWSGRLRSLSPRLASLQNFAEPMALPEATMNYESVDPIGSLTPSASALQVIRIERGLADLTLQSKRIGADGLQLTERIRTLEEDTTRLSQKSQKQNDRVAQMLEGAKTQINNAIEKKRVLEEALSHRDTGLNQFAINRMLVYAVYGMVLSIIALFILLRWYPASLTDLIVQQRVFVEVLSMGFLLVTIIILGSAKLIQGEGLAGLLGTIAGYIFVKKTVDMATADRNADSGSFMDRALGQAHLDIAEIRGEIARSQQLTDDVQSEVAQASMGKLEAKLQEAEQRAKSLTEGITAMTVAKSMRRSIREN